MGRSAPWALTKQNSHAVASSNTQRQSPRRSDRQFRRVRDSVIARPLGPLVSLPPRFREPRKRLRGRDQKRTLLHGREAVDHAPRTPRVRRSWHHPGAGPGGKRRVAGDIRVLQTGGGIARVRGGRRGRGVGIDGHPVVSAQQKPVTRQRVLCAVAYVAHRRAGVSARGARRQPGSEKRVGRKSGHTFGQRSQWVC